MTRAATACLNWIGAHARWILSGGCILILFLPALSAFVRPALPALVMLVLGLSMARIDLAGMAREALRWHFLVRNALLIVLLMPVTGALYLWLAQTFGLGPGSEQALVLLAAAPPIASAAGLAFLLGVDARLSLSATLVATIATPVVGPLMAEWLLGDAIGISSGEMAARLAGMILGGLVLGVLIRHFAGAERIAANKQAFDGIATLGLLAFVIPLFDGVGATILAAPGTALAVLGLATVFNIGVNLAAMAVTWRLGRARAGALGIVWGNRTVAMYLAAVPPDPFFTLFVALYQFPMYFTPLVIGAILRRIR